uniref:Uncharacterized protein n=1 Tax=Arundo donax TaxID=35708 RepID=A0A0A9E0H0_ARUDO
MIICKYLFALCLLDLQYLQYTVIYGLIGGIYGNHPNVIGR